MLKNMANLSQSSSLIQQSTSGSSVSTVNINFASISSASTSSSAKMRNRTNNNNSLIVNNSELHCKLLDASFHKHQISSNTSNPPSTGSHRPNLSNSNSNSNSSDNQISSNFKLSSKKGRKWTELHELMNDMSSSSEEDDEIEDEVSIEASQIVPRQAIDGVKSKFHTKIMRLDRDDMGLFGLCPETDRFYAVLCEDCGAVVKPQGLQRHIESRHHKGKPDNHFGFTETTNVEESVSGSSSSSDSTYSSDKFSPNRDFTAELSPQATSLPSSYAPSSSLPPPPKDHEQEQSSMQIHQQKSEKDGRRKSKSLSPSSTPSSVSTSELINLGTTSITVTTIETLSTDKQHQGSPNHSNTQFTTFGSSNISGVQSNKDNNVHPLQQRTVRFSSTSSFSSNSPSSSSRSSSSSTSNSLGSRSNNNSPYSNLLDDRIVSDSKHFLPLNKSLTLSAEKSNNSHRHHRRSQEYNPNRNCGVADDYKIPCMQSLACKIHSIRQRRLVPGRSDNFDKLLEEYSASRKDRAKRKRLDSSNQTPDELKHYHYDNNNHHLQHNRHRSKPPEKVARMDSYQHDIESTSPDHISHSKPELTIDYMNSGQTDSIQQYNAKILIAALRSQEMDNSNDVLTVPLSVIPSQHSSSLFTSIHCNPDTNLHTIDTNTNFIPIDRYQTEIGLEQCQNSDIRIIDDNLGDGPTLVVRQLNHQEMNLMLDEMDVEPSPRDENLLSNAQLELGIKSNNEFMFEQSEKDFGDYHENSIALDCNNVTSDSLLESQENLLMEKIDIKDLKLLKPINTNTIRESKEDRCNFHSNCKYTLMNYDYSNIKPTQWYSQMPKPMSMNTFDMRYLGGGGGGGGFILASQRKLIEVRKSLQETYYSNNAKTNLNNRYQIFNRRGSRPNSHSHLNGIVHNAATNVTANSVHSNNGNLVDSKLNHLDESKIEILDNLNNHSSHMDGDFNNDNLANDNNNL